MPSQGVESHSFTPPVYSPGKQGTKTKTCSITASMAELGDFEKVIVPKRPRNCKKSSDGVAGTCGKVLQFLPNGTVEDNMMDLYINCINCLNWTPQQSSSREKVRSSNVTSVTKSSRKTLISSSTLGGDLLSRM